MPTIATFGAASARGFGQLNDTGRFIYEFIDTTNQATVGTSWNGQENFVFFSFGGANSAVSKTFSSVTFDGNIGFLNVGSQDNSSGENKTIGMGAINLSTPSTQTVLISATTVIGPTPYYANFRILGGKSQPTVFYSNAQGGATWPYTYSIANCKIGDIVLLGMNYRSTPTDAASTTATNMTAINTSTTMAFVQTFAAYVTSDGTFTTTINGNELQQWTQAIAVLRVGT
jgi:hypothetical protein